MCILTRTAIHQSISLTSANIQSLSRFTDDVLPSENVSHVVVVCAEVKKKKKDKKRFRKGVR